MSIQKFNLVILIGVIWFATATAGETMKTSLQDVVEGPWEVSGASGKIGTLLLSVKKGQYRFEAAKKMDNEGEKKFFSFLCQPKGTLEMTYLNDLDGSTELAALRTKLHPQSESLQEKSVARILFKSSCGNGDFTIILGQDSQLHFFMNFASIYPLNVTRALPRH